jgi:AP endonuclease-1
MALPYYLVDACFLDDLKRCQSLGIGLFNIHPGSALKGNDRSQGCIWVAEGINKALKETEKVCVVLENMVRLSAL